MFGSLWIMLFLLSQVNNIKPNIASIIMFLKASRTFRAHLLLPILQEECLSNLLNICKGFFP